MINVTLGEVKPQEKPFPKLMINKNGAITLFTGDGRGLLLVSAGTSEAWGFYECFDMAHYTDYNEPIAIQNAP